MNVGDKYCDVIIENNSFYIIECSSKPKKQNSALEILAKIENVVTNNLIYQGARQDQYSKLSKEELLRVLKEKSSEIHNGYFRKQDKLNWFVRKFFSKEEKVKAILTKIENYISPAQLLPLPNEILQEMSLEVSSIGNLSANRQGKALQEAAFIRRAREFGYQGSPTQAEANKYIENLFKEVTELAKKNLIPKKYLFYKKSFSLKRKIDPEKTLANLKRMDENNFFALLSKLAIYSNNFKNFDIFFLSCIKEYLNAMPKLSGINASSDVGVALILAAGGGKKEAVQLLLEHGADVNILSASGCPPLHYAAYYGHTEIIELLLKYGADANFRDAKGDTALMVATKAGKKEVVQLLLEHGADASIVSARGNHSPPIHYAAHSGRTDIVELFLQHGADRNLLNSRGETALMVASRVGQKEVVKLLSF